MSHVARTFLVLVLGLAAAPAFASVVGGDVSGGSALGAGGRFVEVAAPLMNPFGPPDSVGNDTFQSPNLFAFDETQNIVLSDLLSLDVGGSPLAAGTTVASHYVFFDPGPSQSIVGTIDFDSTVLGVITSAGFLAASDFLGNAAINYLGSAGRGLETGDSVAITGASQVTVRLTANSPGDYVRVITAMSSGESTSVPEPGVLGLAALALGLVPIATRRRARQVAA